jgi:hypothetical protein
MSVKLGTAIEALFTTQDPTTLAVTDADSLPSGTVYKNGASDALAVTVAKIATGTYRATFTPSTGAGFAAGDDVALRIEAIVSGTTGAGVVWQDRVSTDDVDSLAASIALLALEATAQAIKAKTDTIPASPAETGDEMALTAAALTAIANEIRDSTWTAGGVATVGFLLRCVLAMAKGNFYRTGDEYRFYDDDDTGSEDGTLLFTLTVDDDGRSSS